MGVDMKNPPAFPCDLAMYDQEVADAMKGMTLRDYFAAKAMPELIGFGSPESGAEVAYKWADAMLKARDGQD